MKGIRKWTKFSIYDICTINFIGRSSGCVWRRPNIGLGLSQPKRASKIYVEHLTSLISLKTYVIPLSLQNLLPRSWFYVRNQYPKSIHKLKHFIIQYAVIANEYGQRNHFNSFKYNSIKICIQVLCLVTFVHLLVRLQFITMHLRLCMNYSDFYAVLWIILYCFL